MLFASRSRQTRRRYICAKGRQRRQRICGEEGPHLEIEDEADVHVFRRSFYELTGTLLHELAVRRAGLEDSVELGGRQARLVAAAEDAEHELEVILAC